MLNFDVLASVQSKKEIEREKGFFRSFHSGFWLLLIIFYAWYVREGTK